MRISRILDEPGGGFGLEHDNTLRKKNLMRLDALTYEQALREATSFPEINSEGCDPEGTLWDIE